MEDIQTTEERNNKNFEILDLYTSKHKNITYAEIARITNKSRWLVRNVIMKYERQKESTFPLSKRDLELLKQINGNNKI